MISEKEVWAGELHIVAAAAYDNGRNPLLAMFANDERAINGHFAIYCIFSCQAKPYFTVIKGRLQATEE